MVIVLQRLIIPFKLSIISRGYTPLLCHFFHLWLQLIKSSSVDSPKIIIIIIQFNNCRSLWLCRRFWSRSTFGWYWLTKLFDALFQFVYCHFFIGKFLKFTRNTFPRSCTSSSSLFVICIKLNSLSSLMPSGSSSDSSLSDWVLSSSIFPAVSPTLLRELFGQME